MSATHPSDDTILREILARAERDMPMLPQFHSLAGGRQYRGLYRMTRRWLPEGARVLDWGTGSGHFSYYLTRRGLRSTGFSIDPVSHAGWLDEPYERFVGSPAPEPVRLPFPDAAFDAAASVGVLEHVRETGGDEEASLREIARVLKPGGLFLCYHFPNRTSWIDFVARRMGGKHHHVHRYRRPDIERLLRAAGLQLLELHRYAILPRNGLHRLPARLRRAGWFADLWDALDAGLSALLGPLCQNWSFVARKPAGSPEREAGSATG